MGQKIYLTDQERCQGVPKGIYIPKKDLEIRVIMPDDGNWFPHQFDYIKKGEIFKMSVNHDEISANVKSGNFSMYEMFVELFERGIRKDRNPIVWMSFLPQIIGPFYVKETELMDGEEKKLWDLYQRIYPHEIREDSDRYYFGLRDEFSSCFNEWYEKAKGVE